MARQMKDSGIEWIGEIPEGWRTCKIKDVFQVVSGATPKSEQPEYWDGDIVWVTPADYKTNDKFITFSKRTITQAGYDSCGTTLVPAGSIVFSKRAPIGSVAIARVPLCTNQGCLSCINKGEADTTFFYYVMSIFTEIFELYGSGTTFKELSYDSFAAFTMTNPPLAEQQRIAAFLDRKCTEIDAVIERTKVTIEEYKKLKQAVITEAVTKGVRGPRPMKDSGIEWIGEIPEEWRVVRGKNLFVETNERSTTGEEELLTVSHITGITPRSQKSVNMFMSESLVDYKICRVHDIAANTMWMWQGAIGVSKYHGVISPSYNVYRQTSDAYNPDYLDYLLRIRPLVDAYNAYSTGITASRLRLYPEQFLSFFFFVPTKEEQQEIVKHLNKMCGEMDTLIAKKTALLTELETYKKSLIYEYVTGKRECPEAAAQAAVVYPYFPAVVNTKVPRFAQAVLMAKVLEMHGKGMGRVKLEKMMYTIESLVGFDFDTEYSREAAGPLHESIYKCEGIISNKHKWYKVSRSHHGVSYTAAKDVNEYKRHYDKYFSAYNTEIERIIGIFKPYNTVQAEVVATLFAAWNDAIIDGAAFTDEDVVDDVLNNWHESKTRYPKEMWLRAMAEMRKNNLIPKGYGKLTIRKG